MHTISVREGCKSSHHSQAPYIDKRSHLVKRRASFRLLPCYLVISNTIQRDTNLQSVVPLLWGAALCALDSNLIGKDDVKENRFFDSAAQAQYQFGMQRYLCCVSTAPCGLIAGFLRVGSPSLLPQKDRLLNTPSRALKADNQVIEITL